MVEDRCYKYRKIFVFLELGLVEFINNFKEIENFLVFFWR